jgi:hypothetical protein
METLKEQTDLEWSVEVAMTTLQVFTDSDLVDGAKRTLRELCASAERLAETVRRYEARYGRVPA